MQFLITAYDGTDHEASERRQTARPEHLRQSHAMKQRGELLYAAAILDESERMIGSMMVVEFASRHAVNLWLTAEPYVNGHVWKQITIAPCRPGPDFTGPRP